jgi:hypothetical protein
MLPHRFLCGLVCFLMFAAVSAAHGQQVMPSAYTSDTQVRLATLEQEVMMLRGQAANCTTCTSPCCRDGAVVCDTRRGKLYAGYEFLFAKPHLKESFEATSMNLTTGVLTLTPFSYDYDLTPRVWFGFESASGLGARARYWRYDGHSNPATLVSDATHVVSVQSMTVIFPGTLTSSGPGQVLQTVMGMDAQTLDVEGTQTFQLGRVEGVASLGLRYAKFEQDFTAILTDGGTPIGQLTWLRRFEGLGISAGANFRRPIGNRGFSFVGHGQGSLMFGTKDLERTDYASTPPIVSLDSADEVVGAFELGLGIEWSRKLAIGDLFVRGSYEAQLWTEAGAPTLTFLGFEGFGLALGFTR